MSSGAVSERLLATRDALIGELAADIAHRLGEAIAQRGAARLVAAGGSTPGPLYDVLSGWDLAWNKVTVSLSDERWVAAGDSASNEGLVRARLLRGPAVAARFVGFKTAAASPAQAVAEIDARLATLGPADISLLGMGRDGHVASLFPGAEELPGALDDDAGLRVCAVHRPDAAGAADRLSLTRKGLLETRSIAILIDGEDKLSVYRTALEGDDIEAMPIRMVLQQRQTPARLWWAP